MPRCAPRLAFLSAIGIILSVFALSGCPTQASYQTTITPIYAATNSGLFVHDGTRWSSTPYLSGKTIKSVVVSGSGSGATVFAGTASSGVYYSRDASWTTAPWTTTNGLGSDTINRLFLGSNLYAATSSGLSIYNFDGTWTNDATSGTTNDVGLHGTFTYVAANGGLFIFNGTSQVQASISPNSVLSGSTKINAVLVDSAQDVIAGTDKGLAVKYYGSASFVSMGLPANTNVHGLFLDSMGALYAASGSGLFILGTGTYQALPATAVYCVHVDGAGTIYAGTANGLKISTDGGASWTTSLAGQTINCVVVTAPLYSF